MRTVWVSDDVIGRDCLHAAARSGVEIVGVVTLPEDPGVDRSARWSFADEAEQLGVPRLEARDVNSDEALARIAALEPELVFVVGWYQLVREPFVALAGEGTFGMHPTLLPRHRGRASIPWAILSGLARTGVTLFEIVDASADSGAIVGQVVVDIEPDETATTLFDKISRAHVHLIEVCVPELVAGTAPRHAQDPTRASSWPRRRPADGIIDWETRAAYLYDWVRAQTRPYPGAFTFAGEEKVVVWRARPVEQAKTAPAGTVVAERPDGPVVACGEGALVLEEIETAAKLGVGVLLG